MALHDMQDTALRLAHVHLRVRPSSARLFSNIKLSKAARGSNANKYLTAKNAAHCISSLWTDMSVTKNYPDR